MLTKAERANINREINENISQRLSRQRIYSEGGCEKGKVEKKLFPCKGCVKNSIFKRREKGQWIPINLHFPSFHQKHSI